MTDEKSRLERQLVSDPFDVDARRYYANVLFVAGDYASALKQWQLLAQQNPTSAEGYMGGAICHLRLGDVPSARRQLDSAYNCVDFNRDDPRLEEFEHVQRREPLRLVAVQGEPPDNVPLIPSQSKETRPLTAVKMSDVVGMHQLKKTLRLRIIEPFVKPGLFQRFRKSGGGGVLLYGPPGCGKTMIARAIATECSAAFTHVGISEVLSMWVGESESRLAAIFEQARGQAPSVLFFDELDALAYSRTKARSDYVRTLVNEFLSQLDGMSGNNDRVLVLAATNMPWDVDEAMKRPGRFDRIIFVPPPDADARTEMFRNKLADLPTAEVDVGTLAAQCAFFSGADIDGAIDVAKELVLADILESGTERPIRQDDLRCGIESVESSCLEWLKTARNLVKYGGGGRRYREVEDYLRAAKLY